MLYSSTRLLLSGSGYTSFQKSLMVAVTKFQVYFDASGTPDDCDAVVVAGFIAKSEQWIEFERNWQEVLSHYGVTRLHMREYAHSVGEFSSWRGDRNKRARFLERLVNIIKTRTLHSFATAVMMEAYREANERYRLSELHRPFGLAGIACIEKVRRWSEQNGISQEHVSYIFEDGDEDKSNLTEAAQKQFQFAPSYAQKEASYALQAADLLAYEHLLANRKIYKSGPGTLGLADMRKPLQALDDVPHGKDGGDWGVFDINSLEAHCRGNTLYYPPRKAPTA